MAAVPRSKKNCKRPTGATRWVALFYYDSTFGKFPLHNKLAIAGRCFDSLLHHSVFPCPYASTLPSAHHPGSADRTDTHHSSHQRNCGDSIHAAADYYSYGKSNGLFKQSYLRSG